MPSVIIIQKHSAPNDANGNPRRCWTIHNAPSTYMVNDTKRRCVLIGVIDEGYVGQAILNKTLKELLWDRDTLVDMGEIKCTATQYREWIKLDPSAKLHKRIKITYETWTQEDIEAGDTDDRGWDNETGVDMCPDKYDIEDGLTAVDKAVSYLKLKDAYNASSSRFYSGVWYSDYAESRDLYNDDTTQYSYHLYGFDESEQQQIFDRLTSKTHI